MIPKGLYKIGAIVLVLAGCSGNRHDVDISDVAVSLQVDRLDVDLFEAETDSMQLLNNQLYEKYGRFYEVYLSQVIGQGMPDDPMVGFNLGRYVYDSYVQEGYQEVAKQYSDISVIVADLTEAFRYYKYHFPEGSVPRIITYYSGFNVGVMPTEKELGIGLGMYLGANNPVTNALPHERFPHYKKQRMDPSFVVADAMTVWLQKDFFNLPGESPSLLDQMVAIGKILYLLKAVMPNTDEAILMRYPAEKMQWINDHENEVWRTIVNEDLLFTTDQREMDKMLQDGPFTSFLPKESPARIGAWLGYRMVQDYMDENPKVTLLELVEEYDAQKIMKQYKPKR